MKYEKRSFIFLGANMKYEATSSFKKICFTGTSKLKKIIFFFAPIGKYMYR